jgi:hypothetical protein
MDTNDAFDDPGSPLPLSDAELFGKADDFTQTVCELATVGWDQDAEVYDLGTASNDGNTFLRVTLFKGHPVGRPKSDKGFANGFQYIVRIMLPMWWIPVRGTQCVVVFPGGLTGTPGAGVVIGCVGPSPVKQFAETTAKLDFTGYDLVIKARSITLRDDAGNLVAVAPEGGARLQDSTGSGVVVHEGKVVLTTINGNGAMVARVALDQDEVSVLNGLGNCGGRWMSSGDVSVMGKGINLTYATSLGLGMAPNPALAVMVGPGPSMAALASKAVFTSG